MNRPINLDMSSYKRLQHFKYFKSLAFPYVGITCDVNITSFYNWTKINNFPFFLSFLWCISQAANKVPEFRQRIVGEQIVEYPFCKTSHTVSKDDGTYSYCLLDHLTDFKNFILNGEEKQLEAKINGNVEEASDEKESLFFISTSPWISHTSIVQPLPIPADSNPRIIWGKFQLKENIRLIPVSVLCNHALVDGKHIADFYKCLDDIMKKVQS